MRTDWRRLGNGVAALLAAVVLAPAAGGLLVALLAPFAALLIQLAVSRSREFEAGATGARVVGYPDGLAWQRRALIACALLAWRPAGGPGRRIGRAR